MDSDEKKEFIHDVIATHAAKTPTQTAIYDRDRIITYADLFDGVQSLSVWLEERYPQKTRVGILLNNSYEMVRALYAVSKARMISVPLDADMHARNISYIANDCGIKIILTIDRYIPQLEKIEAHQDFDLLQLDKPDHEWPYPSNGKKAQPPIPPEDTACILYTTGTTGPRKGVVLSHSQLQAATNNINQFMQIGPDVVESLPMRLSHSFGFARLRCVFDVGGSVILENGFLRPEYVLCNLKTKKANALSSVPSGFAILTAFFLDFFRELGPQLKHIEIGSDFMRQDQKSLLMEICPNAKICMHYGLTEASRATFLDFHRDREYLDSVGKPSPNVKIKIGDENGHAVKAGTSGEILVRGKMVMSGYWGNPGMSDQAIIEGWLHTGDFGLIDKEGYVYLLGRSQEIINVGGLKVSPVEIEEVLLRYEGIKEAVVTTVESIDKILQSRIKAFLVVTDTKRFHDFEELKRYCNAELEAYKIPDEFEVVNKIPKSISRKIKQSLASEK